MSGLLRQAAIRGDLEALRGTLAKGPAVDEQDGNGLTPLHLLCSSRGFAGSDRLACFHLLIEAGADPTKRTTSGWFPLLYAAGCGHPELVAALLATSAQSDLNRINQNRLTPLHWACSSRYRSTVECVALLLSRGAAVNARDMYGATPLDYACAYADYEGVVRRIYPVLLRAGAALPALGTDQWERSIGRYSTLNPIRRQADYLYLQSVAAAGGYRNYERAHLKELSGIFVPKFARLLPPEMVRRVVEYAFDVGGH